MKLIKYYKIRWFNFNVLKNAYVCKGRHNGENTKCVQHIKTIQNRAP